MRSIRRWTLGAAAAAALFPATAHAGLGTATLRVTAVVVRSFPVVTRRAETGPSAPRSSGPPARVAVPPSPAGATVFVDGAPTSYAFLPRGPAR